jgi:DNA primase
MIDIEAIRSANPLPSVAGAQVRLHRAGNEWKGCCPFHADRSPSFTIFGGGVRFHCFGCGANGDVLDFLQLLLGVSLRDAASLLDSGDVPTIEIAPALERDDTNRLDQARSIWRKSLPAQGTLVETYLAFRNLTLPIPETIRFTYLRYGKTGREYPVLVAAITSVDRKLTGIQRTYLADDGMGKADVPKPKLSLGRVSGGAIRLAPAAQELIVCEGLEDGLTLQQTLGRAVWVAAGASMLPAMRFPPAVRSVAIGGDADAAGEAAAWKAKLAFAGQGLIARTFFPLGAKDFNAEIMQGAGA